jgi:uncharacterized membrane protein YeaQ/YmgE (transglycosylase-associated protein family)
MSIIVTLIIGGFIGWLAARLMGRHEGIIASIVIGIVGSFIGSFISEITTGSNNAYLTLNFSGFIWSLIGALVLVAILNTMSGRSHHHDAI